MMQQNNVRGATYLQATHAPQTEENDTLQNLPEYTSQGTSLTLSQNWEGASEAKQPGCENTQ
jgi:hypothetical protein